ncbi:aspartate aminotransferase family protein [Sphingobium sp. LB126]|nr:aspartate aminotransferase family protein [Sphingobium sp. LB126]
MEYVLDQLNGVAGTADGDEINLLQAADERARSYTATIGNRRAWPAPEALEALSAFQEDFPEHGMTATDTLRLLDDIGSPATSASTGPNYFGYVIGGVLPAAAAAERLVLAWDQRASTFDSSPVSDVIETQAARWILEALDLPRSAGVGFGTSATACTIACLAAARRALLARAGWNWDRHGAQGAPVVRVMLPETAHVAVIKALRILGFGLDNLVRLPVDGSGRAIVEQVPDADDLTILCLQAGEVNTGSFDDFAKLIPMAQARGAWVHVDGAFGLWARASSSRALCDGVEWADSWTADGHKWLNTPYDGAFAICREADNMATAMSSEAVYAPTSASAQQNLTLEFSRRARGIPIWAALRTLGRDGLRQLVDRNISQAQHVAERLRAEGYEILNDVVLNQVLVRADDDERTQRICRAAQASGVAWFGMTRWEGRPAFRLSFSSWRTNQENLDKLVALLVGLLRDVKN